jgi:hypothetical protein
LTQSAIINGNFGLIILRSVDDQTYVQPLVVTNLAISGLIHNVVMVATANNSVYAFEALLMISVLIVPSKIRI